MQLLELSPTTCTRYELGAPYRPEVAFRATVIVAAPSEATALGADAGAGGAG